MADSTKIESHLHEDRKFPPAEAFAKQARIPSMKRYKKLYEQSIADPESFWVAEASELH